MFFKSDLLVLVMAVMAHQGCAGGTHSPDTPEQGSSAVEADAGQDEGSGGDEAQTGTSAVELHESCPPTYSEANGYCSADGQVVYIVCAYPEGKCTCSAPQHCGGAYMEPPPPEQWMWSCTTPPPEVRADGCPGKLPLDDRDCTEEGKTCWYGNCCTQKAECVKGQWQIGAMMCPP